MATNSTTANVVSAETEERIGLSILKYLDTTGPIANSYEVQMQNCCFVVVLL